MMVWERGYYYRAKKINGQVVKEYVGPGIAGQLAELQDLSVREDREMRQITQRIEREESSANIGARRASKKS
jgi:hypothetical protein